MADPTTSTQPVALAGSDNWLVGGVGAIVRGIKAICDWIGGLSPAGASVYDSGWVTTGFTAQNGSTLGTMKIRRIGNTVELIALGLTTPSLAVAVGSTVSDTAIFTVPSGFAPVYGQALSGTNTVPCGASIDGTGAVSITWIVPPVTATGTTTQAWSVSVGGTYFLG